MNTTTTTEIATPSPSPSPATRVVYLTARPIHLVHKTRRLLSGLQQSGLARPSEEELIRFGLPKGPILGFGGNLAKVLAMEVLSKSTHTFKAGELERHVAGPFRRARARDHVLENNNNEGNSNRNESNTMVAAFGNTLKDVQAYHKIGIDLNRIFMIDENSRIVTFDKPTPEPCGSNHEPNDTEPPEGDDGSHFPPHSWYSDRIGTVFEDGYGDKNLRSFLKLEAL